MRCGIERSWLSSVALRLALVAVLAVGVLRAGGAYFVCTQMESVSAMPCCEHSHAVSDATPAVDRAPCCAREQVGGLPAVTASTDVRVPDAPLVAAIAPVSFDPKDVQARPLDRARILSRAGPPPKDTRAPRLMVFLL